MLLTKLEMLLQVEAEERLSSNIGSLMQGVLMQRIDPVYGEYLHRSELKPYSQYVSVQPSEVKWTLHTLTEQAETELIHPLLSGNFHTIHLEKKKISMKVLSKTVTCLTEEQLLEQTFFAVCPRKLRVNFVTPCSFKRQGVYQIFPSVRLIFQSLVNKFDAASESNAVSYPELLDDLESNVMITGYRLHSTSFGVEGVKIPAYQGSLSLKLLGPQQLVNLVHMLLRFGMYSGVGIKTAMGMGAFQIAERNVLHEGRSIQAHNGGSAP